jgi:hemerythrin-like domain-containing protein
VSLPVQLSALDEERAHLESMLEVLRTSTDPVVRADVADQMVGSVARYENVIHEVVYPALDSVVLAPSDLERGEADNQKVRAALVEIHDRMKNVKPINAHADDPEGFERAVEVLVELVQSHLDHEDQVLLPLLEGMAPAEAGPLKVEVDKAVEHASSHPDPPHNPIKRKLVDMGEALERTLHDQSTPWHPGTEEVEQQEDLSEDIG